MRGNTLPLLLALAVAAFAAWAIWLTIDVRAKRSALEDQVGWLFAISDARKAAAAEGGPPAEMSQALSELRRRFDDEERLVGALDGIDEAYGRRDNAEVTRLLLTVESRVRRENGMISVVLGRRWDQATILVFLSLGFALMALALSVLREGDRSRRQTAEQALAATQDRLSRVGAGLIGLSVKGEVVFSNSVSDGFASHHGSTDAWWSSLVGTVKMPGSVPCSTCGLPARVGRVSAEETGDFGTRVYQLVFGGHAHDMSDQSHQVVFVRDATEQQREEARTLLEERLSSLDDLAGGLAHQLNSPLQVVLGSLQLASREANGDVLEMVEEALEGAERVRAVVRGLEVLRSVPEASLVDLAQVCAAAARLAVPLTQGAVVLQVDVMDDPKVRVDPARLTQALLALVSDSVECCRREGGRHQVTLRSYADAQGVVIEVVDDRSEPTALSGIELALIKEQVQALGAELTLESRPDRNVARLTLRGCGHSSAL